MPHPRVVFIQTREDTLCRIYVYGKRVHNVCYVSENHAFFVQSETGRDLVRAQVGAKTAKTRMPMRCLAVGSQNTTNHRRCLRREEG